MKNADKPINPLANSEGFATSESNFNVSALHGLTKREYFAGLAMQGLISGGLYNDYNPSRITNETPSVYQFTAKEALKMADELLNKLGDE